MDDKQVTNESLLSALVSPPNFRVQVRDLSIVAPPPAWRIPLATPITVPRVIQRQFNAKGAAAAEPRWLVRGASQSVEPGEVLAM